MIEWVTQWVAAGGYTAVFLLCVLENVVPPIPSEVILPLAGFVAARGEMTLWGVILAGAAGTVAGNAVWYEAARRLGAGPLRALVDRHGHWFGATGADLDKAERTLKRHGPVAIAGARVLPGLRTAISLPAGVFWIPRKVFYVWTAVGTTVWTGALVVTGYVLEESYHRAAALFDTIGAVLLGATLLLCAWQWWRVRRRA